MNVKKLPAVVLTTKPKSIWLQAYPHGYPSQKSVAPVSTNEKTFPLVVSHLAKKPFVIPKSWFAAGTTKRNPWHCRPTKLPCGKKGTDYWACNKHGVSK